MTYATQMQKSVPVMAYHCKFYYVQKGLELCKNNPGPEADEAKSTLINSLGDLEQMKQAMGDIQKEDLKYHVENFVLSVFAKADKEERTCETITKRNAMDFKRAGDFIQILSLFPDAWSDEWQEKKKYCVFKAGSIMKALKQGVQPERGNPFAPEEEKKDDVPDESGAAQVNPSAATDMMPNMDPGLSAPTQYQPNAQPTNMMPAAAPAPPAPMPSMGGAPVGVPQQPAAKGAQYYKDIGVAQKEMKSVVKELKVNKCELALQHLRKALNSLSKYSTQRFEPNATAQNLANSGAQFL